MLRVLRRAAALGAADLVLILACVTVWEVAQRIRDNRTKD